MGFSKRQGVVVEKKKKRIKTTQQSLAAPLEIHTAPKILVRVSVYFLWLYVTIKIIQS